MPTNINNDELRDFITSTLAAIHDGVRQSGVSRSRGIAGTDAFRMPEKVAFDVAVTANHSEQSGGGFKVQIAGIGANLGLQDNSSRQSVSRIQFEIPWGYEPTLAGMFPPNRAATKPEKESDTE